jgi:SagB-type dehydrogenase family enzyme
VKKRLMNLLWRIKKMKRLAILALILAFFAIPCYGQRRTRAPQRKVVQLTEPNTTGSVSLEEALAKRRSVRRFSNQPLKWSQIGQLAWAGQGITDSQRGLRTAPSAGSIYPIELLFATQEGLFTYQPAEHSLAQVSDQDIRLALARDGKAQDSAAEAACDIIVAGSVRKLAEQFKDNARSYMLMEAGHIAQNIQLQAVCLGLGSVTLGGFDSQGVRKVCSLSRGLEPLYIIPVGYPAGEGMPNAGALSAAGKKAVLIIASQNYHDAELFETKRVLDAAQVQTFIAGPRRGVIRGTLGGAAEATVLVSRLAVNDYDAIIFIGGPGAVEYFANPAALNIAREAVRTGKVLGAIGIAPSILASANVLAGVQATSLLSEQPRLVQSGAIFTGLAVQRERLIITAVGPEAAPVFGKYIVDALAGL